MQARILVVDDEKDICDVLADYLKKAGHHTEKAYTGEEAIELIKNQIFDVMLLDQRLPKMNGMQVLKESREIDPDILTIVITAVNTVENAVTAMKEGAYDYLMKPVDLEEVKLVLEKALETQTLKREVSRLRIFENEYFEDVPFFSNHPTMQKVKEEIKLVAQTPRTSVLIQGDTGTGKELVAKAIHRWSARKDQPMISVNCTTLNETLAESELFGHERGAFTDAKQMRRGFFELANNGSIFLDEISDMTLSMQPKLLRVLEDRTFRRIGGQTDLGTDVRIIAATNQDLEQKVMQGLFRSDLYYRLKVMLIKLPPLFERVSEVIPLAKIYLQKNNKELKKNIIGISEEAQKILTSYNWPGNVRELKNVIERASILCQKEYIEAEHLMGELKTDPSGSGNGKTGSSAGDAQLNEMVTLQEMEKRHITFVLEQCGNNKSKAARVLDISRSTLREKIKLYSIE